jgi:sodium-dependent dicarboxylate transporter 2/3/5
VLHEGVVRDVGALLLFFLPGDRNGRASDWDEAVQIDWGVVPAVRRRVCARHRCRRKPGLAATVGKGLAGMLPVQGKRHGDAHRRHDDRDVGVGETTSNTASANMVVPVVIALSRGAGVDPLMPALGATMGASLGFMLPVSTPCNGDRVRLRLHPDRPDDPATGFCSTSSASSWWIACVRLLVPLVVR